MKGNGDNIKDIKCKQIRSIIRSNENPKCQEKWNKITNYDIKWNIVWKSITLLNNCNNIKQFQWKFIHNIFIRTQDFKK